MDAVRRIEAGDISEVSAALTRAFYDDPISRHLFPGDTNRADLLRRSFSSQIRHTYLSRGEGYVFGENAPEAAALWLAPGAHKPAAREFVSQILLLAAMGSAVPRMFRLASLLTPKRPRVPHYYLATLGTDPEHQRRGHASAVLAPVLTRCDETGVLAYLECSREENVAFYARHRFRVVEKVILIDGPPLWLMSREPGN